MAKDPAFLFYYQDFLVGVDHMTDEQIGQFIKCLCHQANAGYIRKTHMFNICKTQDNHNIVSEKFVLTEENTYINKRLENEVKRRKKYSESRRNNRKGHHMIDTCETYVRHMETETIAETETKTRAKKAKVFTKPLIKEIILYCKERNNRVNPNKFYNYYESNGWKVGKNKMKNWKAAIRNWETMENDSFNGNGKPKSVTQPEYKHFEEPSDKDKQALDDLMKNTRIKGVV